MQKIIEYRIVKESNKLDWISGGIIGLLISIVIGLGAIRGELKDINNNLITIQKVNNAKNN